MSKRRRIEITVERHWLVWRSAAPRVVAGEGCPQCAGSVALVTADEAAALASVSTRTIYALVENGQLHFTETGEGPLMKLLICPNSLPLST